MTEVPWVFAAPTGATKVTVYWDALPGATGYRVRWGTQSGNYPFSSPYLPATSGTDVYRYTVTGLTSEVEYFFVVEAEYNGLWGSSSEEDSAVPHVGAIPWDTENPWQIIGAMEAQLPPDMRPSPYDDVWVLGPDGKIYAKAGVFPPDGRMLVQNNAVLGYDEEMYPLPVGSPESEPFGQLSLTLEAQAGPFRRVRTPDGYRGVRGSLFLPDTFQISMGSRIIEGRPRSDMPWTYVGSSGRGGEVDVGLAYNPARQWWMPAMRVAPRQKIQLMSFPDASSREVDPAEKRFLPGQTVYIVYSLTRDVAAAVIAGRNMYWEPTFVFLWAPNVHKTASARVKRVHSIAHVLRSTESRSWKPTGSRIFGLEWGDGQILPSSGSGTWSPWSNVGGTESGSYPRRGEVIDGVTVIDWEETLPFMRERRINIQLPRQ